MSRFISAEEFHKNQTIDDTLIVNTELGVGKVPTDGFEIDLTGSIRTSSGITFGTDTTVTNELDDYEEGIFTPTLTTDGVDFDSITYGGRKGSYTKIGNVVYYIITMTTTALTIGSATGNVVIGSLPFTAINDSGRRGNGICSESSNWATGKNPFTTRVDTNGTTLKLWYMPSAGASPIPLVAVDVGTGGSHNNLSITGFYWV